MSAKLASVKDVLYNPALPTLRKMDRDDAMSKLPSEHSRTTTNCTKGKAKALAFIGVWTCFANS